MSLFYICFGVGAGYTLISFVLGNFLEIVSFDFDFDFDVGLASPIKPVVIASFITVFGGVGIICQIYDLSILMSLFLSFNIALLISFLIHRLIIIPLMKAQSTSAPEINEIIGKEAKVTLRIPKGGYGKILYYLNDNMYSAPAKSIENEEISTGTKVWIIRIDKNTFMVSK